MSVWDVGMPCGQFEGMGVGCVGHVVEMGGRPRHHEGGTGSMKRGWQVIMGGQHVEGGWHICLVWDKNVWLSQAQFSRQQADSPIMKLRSATGAT